jgi:hypothetical protein
MRICRYPAGALSADCARGLFGSAVSGGLSMVVSLESPVAWILAAVFALFLVYFARAVVRHLTRIELSEKGVVARGPFGGAVPWDELGSMKLRHYTTRSDRTGGWMQLDLGSRHASIRVDSRLDCFAEIARAAALEALRRGHALDPATRFNLHAMGVPVERNV